MIEPPHGTLLWSAIEAFSDTWPPDNEETAQELARQIREFLKTADTGRASIHNVEGRIQGSWKDPAGDTMADKLAGTTNSWGRVAELLGAQAGLVEGYAAKLIRVKTAIRDTVVSREPEFEALASSNVQQAAELAAALALEFKSMIDSA
ncbi:hypothetical protein [Amycolatopsis sp. WGS_07]|uniref:WXG100-like domain-containing protein n=1 Tax=Amycolatopsis sp. WGS_07 TaxID=3076764 RepID=UPI0038735792